jgi:hypothetical protein
VEFELAEPLDEIRFFRRLQKIILDPETFRQHLGVEE